MTRRRSAAFTKVILATVLFSFNPTLFRLIELPPAEIFWAVNILAVLVVLVYMALSGRLTGFPAALRSWPGTFCVLGAVFTANNILFISAIKKTTVANAIFTHYLAPIFVSGLGLVFLGERITVRRATALLVSLSGLGIILSTAGFSLHGRHFLGIIMGTSSAFLFAQEIVLKKKLVDTFPALTVVALYLLVSAGVLSPFISISEVLSIRPSGFAVLLLSGALVSGVGISLFTSGLRDIHAQEASILGYIEPLGAVLWGAFLLAEIPGWRTLLGGFLILSGTYLIIAHADGAAEPVNPETARRDDSDRPHVQS
jgi:drug/metabolite transporter (DMT)-like permease